MRLPKFAAPMIVVGVVVVAMLALMPLPHGLNAYELMKQDSTIEHRYDAPLTTVLEQESLAPARFVDANYKVPDRLLDENGRLLPVKKDSRDADLVSVLGLVEAYNNTVAMSQLSGHPYPVPDFLTDGDALREQMEAACRFWVEAGVTASPAATGYRYDIEVLNMDVRANAAKVIIQRNVMSDHSATSPNGVDNLSRPEAYVLQKVNGSWKIVNVIFCVTDIPEAFYGLDHALLSHDWISDYSFGGTATPDWSLPDQTSPQTTMPQQNNQSTQAQEAAWTQSVNERYTALLNAVQA